MKFGVDFRCVFGMFFERVLEWSGLFWVTFWCQNDDQKEKGRFVEIVEYCCFQGLWPPFGGPEREKNRVRIRSRFPLGFVMILGSFWESFWEQNSFNNRCGF